MEKNDFIRHVKEVLVWNNMQDALTHAQFEALVDSFARAMKHAHEKSRENLTAEQYYDTLRPAGPGQGEDVWH